MRKLTVLFVAVAAIALVVAAALPRGGDELTRVETAAAAEAPAAQNEPWVDYQAEALNTYASLLQVQDEWAGARYAQEQADAEAARVAEAARYVPPPTPKQQPTYSSAPTSSYLECVKARESGGNYGIYNQSGSGAAGAYQFMPQTWNNTAANAGRPDLVGMSPADASPADQDAMAQHLLAWQGTAPWGSC